MTRIASITIYPIKSLPGIDVDACAVLPSSALANDRRWRLVDAHGNTVNTKRERKLTTIGCDYHGELADVTLSAIGAATATFSLHKLASLSTWFSSTLGYPVELREDAQVGFPDDLEAPGPTLISWGTLTELGRWWPELSQAELRRRFRANIVVDATESFWEDRLVGESTAREFSLGDVRLLGEKICQRCAVPSLDTQGDGPTANFAKHFTRQREASLPTFSPRGRFDHFYRAAINTRLATTISEPSTLRVGDAVTIVGGA